MSSSTFPRNISTLANIHRLSDAVFFMLINSFINGNVNRAIVNALIKGSLVVRRRNGSAKSYTGISEENMHI